MSPDFDLRLDSMRRAMTNVVLPAIDPADSLAIEQASLVVAHLSMMLQQWDRIGDYARLCVAELGAVVARLDPRGGPLTLAAANELCATMAAPAASPNKAFRNAMAALEELVRAAEVDGDRAFRTDLRREVLLHANHQATRDRTWVAASGFDVNVGQLPTIEQLFSQHHQPGPAGTTSHGGQQ